MNGPFSDDVFWSTFHSHEYQDIPVASKLASYEKISMLVVSGIWFPQAKDVYSFIVVAIERHRRLGGTSRSVQFPCLTGRRSSFQLNQNSIPEVMSITISDKGLDSGVFLPTLYCHRTIKTIGSP